MPISQFATQFTHLRPAARLEYPSLYDYARIILHTWRSYDMWPSPGELCEACPIEHRSNIADIARELDFPYLFALSILASLFWGMQEGGKHFPACPSDMIAGSDDN